MGKTTRAIALVGLAGAVIAGLVVVKPWAASSRPAAASSASGRAPEQEIVARGLKVVPRAFSSRVHAVGTLAANESVSLASEVSRRVVRIGAEDGARVKKGDVLFELDAADLSARQNELSVRRRLLVDDEARKKKLLAEGLATEAEHQKARSELDLLDAQLETLRVEHAKTRVRAPFDGRLGLRKVSLGALVSPQTVLVSIEDDSRVKVDFSVPERAAAMVRQGSRFSFKVEGSVESFEGTVVAMEPKLAQDTRSLLLRGVADKVSPMMLTGASVSVELAVGADTLALFVPSEAVIPSVGGHSVFRLEDGVAKPVEVVIGLRSESDVQIKEGLRSGDVVIIDNLLRLRPGAKVKLRTEDPAPAPALSASGQGR